MKVKFVPQNIELEIKPNQSVMELAHENGVVIKSVCNGMPSCAECRVRVIEGEYNVLPPSSKELSLIGTGFFIDQRRLSCQLICFGDITVDLSEQLEKVAEGPRRPQGSVVKSEAEESYAVTGNLIEDDEDSKSVAQSNEEVESSLEAGPISESSFYKELYNGKKEGPKEGQMKSERGPSQKPGRNRNRNRGRNRRHKT